MSVYHLPAEAPIMSIPVEGCVCVGTTTGECDSQYKTDVFCLEYANLKTGKLHAVCPCKECLHSFVSTKDTDHPYCSETSGPFTFVKA